MGKSWGGSEQGRSNWWGTVTGDEPSGCAVVAFLMSASVATGLTCLALVLS